VGQGGEMLAPMGRAVIGGVITSTVLTLLIVPVLYTYLHRLAERTKAFWHRKSAKSEPVGQTTPL
jgi:HAE1 family hydrophobic/amphiphilic exporter-1